MSKIGRLAVLAFVLSLLASAASGPLAQEAAPAPAPAAKSELFTGTIMVINAPRSGVVRLKVTIDRWTTDDERKVLADALKTGGGDALSEAMDKMETGYVQIDNNLRWPIRTAATWKTDKGRMVRFTTNRPINFLETWNATRSRDYPFGLIELLLPPEGKGEGVLLVATQVQFNAEGRLEVKSLPSNTGPQRVTNVESELVEPKKSKKK